MLCRVGWFVEKTQAKMMTTHGVITELHRSTPETFAAIKLLEGRNVSCKCREVTITKQDFEKMMKRQERCKQVSVSFEKTVL